MIRPRVPAWFFFTAFIAGACVWLFAQRVLIHYQVADAAVHDRPRGNLSDLYPRWLGARELLLHGRDPYSPEVAGEIQAGYYGRPLDRARAHDPKDQEGFAYPVYVVFYLAPTVHWQFEVVKRMFFWLLLITAAMSVLIWLRVLGWQLSLATCVVVLVFAIGSLAVMQGLKLEQMSLLVAGLIAITILLLVKERQVAAGIVLAAASIKPQLVAFLLIWLAFWTFDDLRRRYRWALSFALAMAIQVVAAEWYLPHWIPRFWQAVRSYRDYTGAVGVMEEFAGPLLGRSLETLAFALLVWLCWKNRSHAANTGSFARMASAVLAFTVLLVPTYAVYNQVLLIPALLLLVEARHTFWRTSPVTRLLFLVTASLVAWPWISSTVLVASSFVLPPETVERAWAVPFWTALLVPVGVAAMMLIYAGQGSFADSAELRSS